MSLSITPETTVGALLETYPACEGVLIAMAPEFAKLRNPVVRRTVARIATLEQAARIGGVNLHAMIRELRAATGEACDGQDLLQALQATGPDEPWLADARVVEDVDADAMLERGAHPIGKIRETVAALGPGEAVVLRSSFRPEPLIETMRRAGAAVHSVKSGSTHRTYFGRQRG